MSETVTLTCDQCGAEDEVPAHGWISIRPSRRSEVVSTPPAKGDFCGQPCLTTYVGRMAIQVHMDQAMDQASMDLSRPADPDTGEIADN